MGTRVWRGDGPAREVGVAGTARPLLLLLEGGKEMEVGREVIFEERENQWNGERKGVRWKIDDVSGGRRKLMDVRTEIMFEE